MGSDHPRCPVCSESVSGKGSLQCPSCEVFYHSECYEYNGKCGIFGCGGKAAPAHARDGIDALIVRFERPEETLARADPGSGDLEQWLHSSYSMTQYQSLMLRREVLLQDRDLARNLNDFDCAQEKSLGIAEVCARLREFDLASESYLDAGAYFHALAMQMRKSEVDDSVCERILIDWLKEIVLGAKRPDELKAVISSCDGLKAQKSRESPAVSILYRPIGYHDVCRSIASSLLDRGFMLSRRELEKDVGRRLRSQEGLCARIGRAVTGRVIPVERYLSDVMGWPADAP